MPLRTPFESHAAAAQLSDSPTFADIKEPLSAPTRVFSRLGSVCVLTRVSLACSCSRCPAESHYGPATSRRSSDSLPAHNLWMDRLLLCSPSKGVPTYISRDIPPTSEQNPRERKPTW